MLQLHTSTQSQDFKQQSLEIIPVYDKNIDQAPDAQVLEKLGYEAEHGTCCLVAQNDRLYVGINKHSVMEIQIAASNTAKELKKLNYINVNMKAFNDLTYFDAFVVGLLLGDYSFEKYKSKPKESKTIDVNFYLASKDHETALIHAKAVSDATNFARDIVNTTPQDMFPKAMAQLAQSIAKELNLTCNILGENALLEEDMQAMYAVGRASVHESQLIHLAYTPKNAKMHINLIGKGLTYDSGGLSLKPADSMLTMKMDKSGGATVLAIIKAIATLKLPVEVHAFVGAVENMPAGNAYKPDDVLKAKNGTTIEVRNTDAEGRLVLADVLAYAQQEHKSDYIFDYATLTGACVVALGSYTTGLMGHNTALIDTIKAANDTSGELSCHLCFNDFLKEELKSDVADIKNTASRFGGAVTAGLFLDHFIEEENKDKWVHFDIAGSAYTQKPWGVNPYGGTGAAVRLTLSWLLNALQSK